MLPLDLHPLRAWLGPVLLLAAALPVDGSDGWDCRAGEDWPCFGAESMVPGPTAVSTAERRDAPIAPASAAPDPAPLYQDLPWDYCGPRPPRLGPAPLVPPPGKDEPVYISADSAEYDRTAEQIALRGGIQVDQGSRQIRADEMTYDLASEALEARGHTYLTQPGVRLIGDRGTVNLKADQGSLWDLHYRFTGTANARGSAARAELLSPTLSQYEDISYTTCPPGRTPWLLQASRLEVDQAEGRAVARHARLRLGKVPVLYTPYLSFPIDDRRKSGILVPTLASSDERGLDITVPYYWNIAPNLDATFSPRYMSKRGAMLGAEVRFLTPKQSGQVYGEILPNDQAYDGDGPRGAYQVTHRGRYSPSLSSDLYISGVSDDTYLEDFGNRLEVTSVRNLERRGDLFYSGQGWSLLSRVQDFQTVDRSIPPADRPYSRLPQMLFNLWPRRIGPGIELGLNGEYSYFDHGDKVHGQRLALLPTVSWPLRRSYGHLIPRVNLYHASYALRDEPSGIDSDPSHTVPSFNLDGKLIFERSTHWLGTSALQTLEPRAYYLYTPYEDQDDTPTFDTAELTFSFGSLFRPNRFTGRDRVGDANQLTLGLTSRTIDDDSGLELFRASLGQILYFEDRRVQLVGDTDAEGSSALVAELATRIGPEWSARAGLQWDPNQSDERLQKRALELHYETPGRHLVNLAYRYDLGTTEATRYEDTDLSVRWPVGPQLELVGRWFYSWLYDETLEAFAGLEYGQCCWRVRVLGRHFKNRPEETGSNSVMVQLELSGLGALGHQIDKFLERGIYGYRAE